MKENKSNNPKTEDVMLIRAFKIDDIDLEPTEDEIDYFLTHDYTVAMEGGIVTSSSVEVGVLGHMAVQESYADFVAMNRKNSENSLPAAAQKEVDRKRQELLDRLAARHANSE